jgi:hypothetical protein
VSVRKVLMITEVTAHWDRMAEFNERWERENLPYWLENGARYIGSFTNHLGDDTNKTLRVFEFEGLATLNRYLETRQAMFESTAGGSSVSVVQEYVQFIRETVWISTSPQRPA